MGEFVMTTNGTIDYGSLSTITGGTISVTSSPSSVVFAVGNNVYRGIINGAVAGANAAGFIDGSVSGTWSINATSTTTHAEGQFVIRENDTGTIIATGSPVGGGPPASVPGGTVEVVNAGQDKVLSE